VNAVQMAGPLYFPLLAGRPRFPPTGEWGCERGGGEGDCSHLKTRQLPLLPASFCAGQRRGSFTLFQSQKKKQGPPPLAFPPSFMFSHCMHRAVWGGGRGGGDRFIHFALAKIMTIHDVSPLPDELEPIGRAEYAADSFLYSCIIRKYFRRAFLN
jgi:hypothetical protein